MGINQGGKLLHTLKGLGITQVYSIANQRAQVAGQPGQPRIDVDISWMVRKCYLRLSVPRAIDALVSVFGKLASMGFLVTLVFDPCSRHHTKKASIRRSHNREWARAEAVKVKIALMNVGRQLKSCLEEERRTELLHEQDVLLKKNRAAETLLSTSLLPDDLMDRLHDELHKDPRTRDVMCMTGEFQADSCLARRMIYQETDLLLANDSDFPCLVGRPCLIIKDFRMSKQSDLVGIEIASGFLETINDAASNLGTAENHPSLKRAIFPLLDGVEDARTRCLIAVLMSCDVAPPKLKSESFLKGLGPSKIQQMIKKVNEEQEGNVTFTSLLEAVMKLPTQPLTTKWDENVVCTLVDSMLFEPANDTESSRSWMHGPPSHELRQYNEAFSPDNARILDGPELAECPGPSTSNCHMFMQGEGSRHCASCMKSFCKLCTSKVHKDDISAEYVWMCARCFSHHIDESDGNDEDVKVAHLSQSQLRDALLEQTQVPANASLVDLQELYAIVIEGNALNFYDAACREVTYPLLSGSAIADGRLRILSKFDVRDGGCFIRHESLTPRRRRAIVSLLAELVTFGRKSKEFPKAASALPDIIVLCTGYEPTSNRRATNEKMHPARNGF